VCVCVFARTDVCVDPVTGPADAQAPGMCMDVIKMLAACARSWAEVQGTVVKRGAPSRAPCAREGKPSNTSCGRGEGCETSVSGGGSGGGGGGGGGDECGGGGTHSTEGRVC